MPQSDKMITVPGSRKHHLTCPTTGRQIYPQQSRRFTMSFIQDVVTLFLPQAWSDLLEVGGIRYKAASIQKKRRIRCPGCSSVSMMPLEYQASE